MMSDPQKNDGELLKAFVSTGAEAPFEELVRRHGPMVFGVCRRILGRTHDSEDAVQAVFLTLANKARSLIGRESIGGWLHHVAWHVARRAQAGSKIQRTHEREAGAMKDRDATLRLETDDPDWQALRPFIDEELQALPEKYRQPLILHHLEGHTKEQTAALLASNSGTISARLDRGREQLRERLARRGVICSSVLLLGLISKHCPAAELPAGFSTTMAQSAALFSSGNAGAGAVSAPVAALVKGAGHAMLMMQLKTAALVALALIVLAGSAAAVHVALKEPPIVAGAGPAPSPLPPADPPTPDADAKADPAEALWKKAVAAKEAKTYALSLSCLRKLLKDYPTSEFASKAHAELDANRALYAGEVEPLAGADTPALYDAKNFKDAPVVLRVKMTKDLGTEKYTHQVATVVKVLKNDSGADIPNEVTVLTHQDSAGLPKEECTVYIKRYDVEGSYAWMADGIAPTHIGTQADKAAGTWRAFFDDIASGKTAAKTLDVMVVETQWNHTREIHISKHQLYKKEKNSQTGEKTVEVGPLDAELLRRMAKLASASSFITNIDAQKFQPYKLQAKPGGASYTVKFHRDGVTDIDSGTLAYPQMTTDAPELTKLIEAVLKVPYYTWRGYLSDIANGQADTATLSFTIKETHWQRSTTYQLEGRKLKVSVTQSAIVSDLQKKADNPAPREIPVDAATLREFARLVLACPIIAGADAGNPKKVDVPAVPDAAIHKVIFNRPDGETLESGSMYLKGAKDAAPEFYALIQAVLTAAKEK